MALGVNKKKDAVKHAQNTTHSVGLSHANGLKAERAVRAARVLVNEGVALAVVRVGIAAVAHAILKKPNKQTNKQKKINKQKRNSLFMTIIS